MSDDIINLHFIYEIFATALDLEEKSEALRLFYGSLLSVAAQVLKRTFDDQMLDHQTFYPKASALSPQEITAIVDGLRDGGYVIPDDYRLLLLPVRQDGQKPKPEGVTATP